MDMKVHHKAVVLERGPMRKIINNRQEIDR